jgi:hypothetical protein
VELRLNGDQQLVLLINGGRKLVETLIEVNTLGKEPVIQNR